MGIGTDIRQEIFEPYMEHRVTASLIAETSGTLSGIQRARDRVESLGALFGTGLTDGGILGAGQEVARVTGNPVQIAQAEEQIIGALSKSSGIATAARNARDKAGSRCQVVSGGWKKMPLEIKELVRQAVFDGGVETRISQEPFIYLDKNYVRIFGGVRQAVQAVSGLGRAIVVQVRGELEPLKDEAIAAVRGGAAVVMVDTGQPEDLRDVTQALRQNRLRDQVRVAFAGKVSLSDLEGLVQMDVDVVDIGYAVVDAPCLPMRFDVVRVE
jgi:nicotinate-nucleotide pyrophosphorylase (carboxylating)